MSPPTPLNAVRMAFLTSSGVAAAVPARATAGCERGAGAPVALRATTAPAVPRVLRRRFRSRSHGPKAGPAGRPNAGWRRAGRSFRCGAWRWPSPGRSPSCWSRASGQAVGPRLSEQVHYVHRGCLSCCLAISWRCSGSGLSAIAFSSRRRARWRRTKYVAAEQPTTDAASRGEGCARPTASAVLGPPPARRRVPGAGPGVRIPHRRCPRRSPNPTMKAPPPGIPAALPREFAPDNVPCRHQQPRQRIIGQLVQPPPGNQEHLADHLVGQLAASPAHRVGVNAVPVSVVQPGEPVDRVKIIQRSSSSAWRSLRLTPFSR